MCSLCIIYSCCQQTLKKAFFRLIYFLSHCDTDMAVSFCSHSVWYTTVDQISSDEMTWETKTTKTAKTWERQRKQEKCRS